MGLCISTLKFKIKCTFILAAKWERNGDVSKAGIFLGGQYLWQLYGSNHLAANFGLKVLAGKTCLGRNLGGKWQRLC